MPSESAGRSFCPPPTTPAQDPAGMGRTHTRPVLTATYVVLEQFQEDLSALLRHRKATPDMNSRSPHSAEPRAAPHVVEILAEAVDWEKGRGTAPREQEAQEDNVQENCSVLVWRSLLSGVLRRVPIRRWLYRKFRGPEVD